MLARVLQLFETLGAAMKFSTLYSLAADAILVTHVLFVVFVLAGLILIYVGKFLDWKWTLNPWLRITHIFAIGVVVLQSWIGVICPLTIWEMKLRALAGNNVYTGSFVSHWLSKLLYFQAPQWVFLASYTVFGILVLLSWFLVRPQPCRTKA